MSLENKLFQNNIISELMNDTVKDVQDDLIKSAYSFDSNIYDEINNINNNDVSNILKTFNHYKSSFNKSNLQAMLKLLLIISANEQELSSQDQIKIQIAKLKLKGTPNKSIYVSDDNKYYQIKQEKLIQDKNILSVDQDGSYKKIMQINSGNYYATKKFDVNNEELSITLYDSNNKIINDKNLIAKLLYFKKEYINQYKLTGYSGNSHDIIGILGNIMSKPIESGYYIDKYYSFYKWNYKISAFVKTNLSKNLSPLLTDYEFKNNDVVIRTEYKGAA